MLTLTSEQENIEMYREYGIAEWREKCLVLGTDAFKVEACLKRGEETDLTKIVKLPFPDFAITYFNSFAAADDYTSDPAFGFKLYMLKLPEIKLFSEVIKKAKVRKVTKDRLTERGFIKIAHALRVDLESLLKAPSVGKIIKDNEFKFIYISQYIDTSKAQQLGMSIVPLLEADEDIDGYNIEGKLDLFNPVVRTVIARTLGMYGYDRTSISKLSDELGISCGLLSYFVNLLIPLMKRTFGEVKYKLKIVNSIESGMIEYNNKEFREKDISAECIYYLKQCATSAERRILSSLSNEKMKLYIVSKYFGWTEEQVCRNMIVIPEDIEKAHELAQKKENGEQ